MITGIVLIILLLLTIAEITVRKLDNLDEELKTIGVAGVEQEIVNIWHRCKMLIYLKNPAPSVLLKSIFMLLKLSILIVLKDLPRLMRIKILIKQVRKGDDKYARQREKCDKSKAR